SDLAVLIEDRGEVWTWTGNGDGTFAHRSSIAAGPGATGLTLVPGEGPGLFDLLVGNEFGDVLRLVGQGDGNFAPPPPFSGDRVALRVEDLDGNGRPDVLVANQQANHVTVQTRDATGQFTPVGTVAAFGPAAAFAPGNVGWARLEGQAGPFYAIVVGTGSNNV